jgi:CheY-like chemotaxis protein
VKLVVRDTGTGMPPEVKARAFDPFFTTKERGKGSGLGLSTVYGIIKQSGGSIAIDSEPGCGAAVTNCLPRVEAVVESEPATVVQRTAPTTATLLFVEDEPLVRELTVKFLNRSGFTVFEAADGVEALELSRRHEGVIDLLVTDVVMPRMGGRELALALLAERPRLRVLFISGYTDDAGDLREVAGDAGDFLQKPFRPEVLVARVRGLLERADSRG